MADSNITKRALAAALKQLMEEMPFEKINVANICEKCDMHRKSFYYHFKDKYDLVNWIFDTDFIALTVNQESKQSYHDRFEFIETVCRYFYDNRKFYRKALQIKGQNSFSDHFREYIQPLLRNRIANIWGNDEVDPFFVDFFTDATLCMMERWLLSKDCMTPDQFVAKIKLLIEHSITSFSKMMNDQ